MAWCQTGDKPLSEEMVVCFTNMIRYWFYWCIYASIGFDELSTEWKCRHFDSIVVTEAIENLLAMTFFVSDDCFNSLRPSDAYMRW